MSDIVVRPVRFTDDVDGMRRFLTALGMRPRLESDSGGWVDMVGDSGMVALHSAKDSSRGAPSGLTSLSFEAGDVDALAKRLQAADVADVAVYDESYGRVLVCTDPLGDQLAVDERADDLYGYRQHEPLPPAAGLVAVAVRFCAIDGPYGGFLEAMGLQLRGEASYVAAYRPDDAGGQVLLHPAADGMPPFGSESGAVRLSFESAEPFDAIGERLTAAGFDVAQVDAGFAILLHTTDPDGLVVEVYPPTSPSPTSPESRLPA